MSDPAPAYPFIRLLTEHGRLAAAVAAGAPLLLALLWVTAGPLTATIAGIGAASAGLYVAVRALTELMQVIADMLLPR